MNSLEQAATPLRFTAAQLPKARLVPKAVSSQRSVHENPASRDSVTLPVHYPSLANYRRNLLRHHELAANLQACWGREWRQPPLPPRSSLLPAPRPPCSGGANQWRRKLLPKFQGRVDSATKRQARAQYLLAKSAPLPVPAGNPWNIDGEFLFFGGWEWEVGRGGEDGCLNGKGDINDGCHLVCVEASGFVVMTLAAGSDRKTFYWRVHKPGSICGDDMPADCTRNKKTSDRRGHRYGPQGRAVAEQRVQWHRHFNNALKGSLRRVHSPWNRVGRYVSTLRSVASLHIPPNSARVGSPLKGHSLCRLIYFELFATYSVLTVIWAPTKNCPLAAFFSFSFFRPMA